MKFIGVLCVLVLLACKEKSDSENVSINKVDYDDYLNSFHAKDEIKKTYEIISFWEAKYQKDPNGIGSFLQLSEAYEKLYSLTGNDTLLIKSQQLLEKGLLIAATNYKDNFQKALAHNYATQHQFDKAYQLLKETLNGVSHKQSTKWMLIDVCLELDYNEEAYNLLQETKNLAKYQYLIRLSRWCEKSGDLKSAIKYLEKAKDMAIRANQKENLVYCYNSLAHCYDHYGNSQKAYTNILNALALMPSNVQAKKNLGNLILKTNKNIKETSRIIDSIQTTYNNAQLKRFKEQFLAW